MILNQMTKLFLKYACFYHALIGIQHQQPCISNITTITNFVSQETHHFLQHLCFSSEVECNALGVGMGNGYVDFIDTFLQFKKNTP